MLFAHHGKRRVHAHRRGWLHTVFRHRQNHLVHVLVIPAKRLVENVALLLRGNRDFFVRDFQIGKMQKISVKPFAIRIRKRKLLFTFLVGNQALLHGVHEQNAPRHQARFFHDVFLRNFQNTDLACQNQHIIASNIIATRAKTISVKRCAQNIAVRKQNRRRTVPRLHHRRPIMIEIAFFRRHCTVVLPRLWNADHHGKRKRHSVHHQKLQRVIKHCAIRAACVDCGKHFANVVVAQCRRRNCLFPRNHSVGIAANRVDFAIVRNKTVRMRPLPARIRVCGKPRMDNGKRARVILAL